MQDTATGTTLGRGSRRRRLLAGGALGAITVVALLPLRLVEVRGASMHPTLCDGDTLLVVLQRWAPAVGVDDLVVLDDPAGTGNALVKRVVGLPGQSVRIADGTLVRDGDRVDEPWADPATMPGVFSPEVVVAEGYVYVLGDDREVSIDSRDFGPVPRSALTGRVVTRFKVGCGP